MDRSSLGVAFFKPIFDSIGKSVVITSPDASDPRILYVNQAFVELTGYRAEEVSGLNPRFLQGPKTDRSIIDGLKQSLFTGRHFLARTYNYHKNGAPFVMEWVVHPLLKQSGDVAYFIAFQQASPEGSSTPPMPLDHPELDLLQLMLTVQDIERERIARDLHDSMGQLLAAARMQAAVEQSDHAETIMSLLDRAIQENRNITFNLMPESLRTRGLPVALRELALRATHQHTSVVHRTQGVVQQLVEWQAFSIFRIAQEALQNALRHANTDMILILETYSPTRYELLVRDFGSGIKPHHHQLLKEGHHGAGLGMRNMHMRAEMIQARMDVFSVVEEGTSVRLTLDQPAYIPKAVAQLPI